MYVFGIHLRPVLMERRLERCQNDVQLWRVARFFGDNTTRPGGTYGSATLGIFLRIQDSKQARPAQCNLQWWRLLFIQQQGRKRPNNVWSWGAAELHVERRLERRQNDVQLWRAARVWRQHHKTRRHLWVSNYRHYILHIQDSKQARSAQCNLLGCTLERQGHQQVSFSSTSRSAGQQAGTSRVTNMGGSAQTMSGLEGRLSCMWNDVWNDVKTTSRCRDFSTWQ